MVVKATAGPVSDALTDVGIDDKIIKEIAATMKANSSVFFVLVGKSTSDRVLEEIKGTGGKIIKTLHSYGNKGRLQTALSAAEA